MDITSPYKKDLFINSEIYPHITEKSKLTIIDGGSRGDIFPPFDKVIRSRLLVIGFEPDNEAQFETDENTITINKALWSNEATIDLHIATEPSTSSVYPPNKDLLETFEDIYGYPVRKTVKKEKVKSSFIDKISSDTQKEIDLIKLDIHSAEYEALLGAKEVISNQSLCVMVETWTSPIHKNQHLHSNCELFLNENNFVKFGTIMEASFLRKHHLSNDVLENRQVVGYDSVFFKNLPNEYSLTKVKAGKLIALADIFGFISYALQINDFCKEKGLFSKEDHKTIETTLVKINQKPKTSTKLINKLKSIKGHIFR